MNDLYTRDNLIYYETYEKFLQNVKFIFLNIPERVKTCKCVRIYIIQILFSERNMIFFVEFV